MKYISWYSSPTGINMGYGYSAVCLISALQRKKIKVDFMSPDAPVHISFIQPEWYQVPLQTQYKIGYTPWESTVIPANWPEYISNMDDFWTTSKFCQEVFASYDVDSFVLPHGIDPEIFSIHERIVNDKFIFFHMGEPTQRKGGQLVADAFLELFGDDDNVHLLMKSTGPTTVRWSKGNKYMGSVASHPRIHVVDFDVDLNDLASLYHNSHCCVYPSNGEGFGLIPFQAIATGMPTILTNATGLADFAHLGLPLDYDWGKGYGIHLGEWAYPKKEHLKELMLQVYNNWETENKRAIQNARILHSIQTWDHVADMLIERVGDRIQLP